MILALHTLDIYLSFRPDRFLKPVRSVMILALHTLAHI